MEHINKKFPLKCPSCNSLLTVKVLHCKSCSTEVNGNFDLPILTKLADKEQQFILDFIKSSGSLKDMAKNMGVSYPTVRNLLDDLIEKVNEL